MKRAAIVVIIADTYIHTYNVQHQIGEAIMRPHISDLRIHTIYIYTSPWASVTAHEPMNGLVTAYLLPVYSVSGPQQQSMR